MTPAETPTECAACEKTGFRSPKGSGSWALDIVEAHHALEAEKDARIRELVGLVRELLESGEWMRSMAEDGSLLDELTKRAKAALARSEGGT